jgi:hypothetical protein
MNVMDRLFFASGWPVETPAKAIETVYSINGFANGTQLPSIPRPLLRSIVERDVLAELGIPGSGKTPANTTVAKAERSLDPTVSTQA